jgi:hypothetical protein
MHHIRFRAPVWLYAGSAAWHFISLPGTEAEIIRARQAHKPRRGFGAIKVEVTIGSQRWLTSVFPDSKRKTYLLPLKATVRRRERIKAGDTVEVAVHFLQ